MSGAGIVGQLLAKNSFGKPVLLLDGEQLVGAKQNRILNISVLLPEERTVSVPVSCVEQGRWRFTSNRFEPSEDMLFAQARSNKAFYFAEKRRRVGGAQSVEQMYASDQMGIWDDVQASILSSGATTSTAAMAATYETEAERLRSNRAGVSTGARPSWG